MTNSSYDRKNVYLNLVSVSDIFERRSKTGHLFYSVRIPWQEAMNGFASIAINEWQILECAKRYGSDYADFRNIFLGKEGDNCYISYLKGVNDLAEEIYTREEVHVDDIQNALADYRNTLFEQENVERLVEEYEKCPAETDQTMNAQGVAEP